MSFIPWIFLLKTVITNDRPLFCFATIDSAVIYAAYQNGTYMSTNEEISAGEGVSDGLSLYFEAGKSYRIRMINMGTLASKYPYNISPSYPCFKVAEYVSHVVQCSGRLWKVMKCTLLKWTVSKSHHTLLMPSPYRSRKDTPFGFEP